MKGLLIIISSLNTNHVVIYLREPTSEWHSSSARSFHAVSVSLDWAEMGSSQCCVAFRVRVVMNLCEQLFFSLSDGSGEALKVVWHPPGLCFCLCGSPSSLSPGVEPGLYMRLWEGKKGRRVRMKMRMMSCACRQSRDYKMCLCCLDLPVIYRFFSSNMCQKETKATLIRVMVMLCHFIVLVLFCPTMWQV